MNCACVLAGIVLTAVSAFAQSTRPAFDAATIKLNKQCGDGGGRSGGASSPGRVNLQCADLRDLILTAYGIYGSGSNPAPSVFRMQVIGGPAWMDSTQYDIVARPAGNPPRSEMYGTMMQALLEDRFQLKVHRETREGGIYLLTVAKNGLKMPAAKQGSCIVADVNHPRDAANATTRECGKPIITSGSSVVTVDIPGATIDNLCAQLDTVMDREVVDRTGLSGRFDIHLEVTPADLHPKYVAGRNFQSQDQPGADDPDAAPSISTALQQQLGLKLQTGKGPVEVIVVDHIERPTDN